MSERRDHSRPLAAIAAMIAALALALVLAAVGGAPEPADGEGKAKRGKGLREMLFVGNNRDGTADVIRPRGKYRRIARLNIIPDIEERMAEIGHRPRATRATSSASGS